MVLPFLLIAFLSVSSLSRDRVVCLFEPSREELLELDEYDDSLSDPLDDEPKQKVFRFLYFLLTEKEVKMLCSYQIQMS